MEDAAGKIIVLSGGVGGAKLVSGLSRVMPAENLAVFANVGDDFDYLGLRICPDLDSITYALAGLNDVDRGWGRTGETWNFMAALGELAQEDWFNLGDRDLALHVTRTHWLANGLSLSEVTAKICAALSIRVGVYPISDHPVATMIETDRGRLSFQEYFVRNRCLPAVNGFAFDGIDGARLNRALLALLDDDALAGVVIAPSNPYMSIDPILGVGGLADRLRSLRVPVIAVSPIVGGHALKGPLAKTMDELGIPKSAASIASHYSAIIDGLIIDEVDRDLLPEIERIGISARTERSVMRTDSDKENLARACLDFIDELRREKMP